MFNLGLDTLERGPLLLGTESSGTVDLRFKLDILSSQARYLSLKVQRVSLKLIPYNGGSVLPYNGGATLLSTHGRR